MGLCFGKNTYKTGYRNLTTEACLGRSERCSTTEGIHFSLPALASRSSQRLPAQAAGSSLSLPARHRSSRTSVPTSHRLPVKGAQYTAMPLFLHSHQADRKCMECTITFSPSTHHPRGATCEPPALEEFFLLSYNPSSLLIKLLNVFWPISVLSILSYW